MKKFFLIWVFILSGYLVFGDSIQFSADSMEYIAAEGSEFTILSGNAYVKTGNKEISAGEIRLYGDDYSILIAEVHVEVFDTEEEFKINTEVLYYDRKSRITRINGRSVMEDYKNEMIIKSGFLEYYENRDFLTLQIGVRILKEDLTCRSEFATYNKDSNTLILTGLPVVYKKEDVFQALKIHVNLDSDEIQMDGKVEGSLIIEDNQ